MVISMYTFDSRIRYSELDSRGTLSLGALLNYFQDCSTFHSEDIGVGLAYLFERNMVWVMSAWQIVVERYPALGEKVVIGTAPYEFKGFMGLRNFVMKTKAGETLACANTVWTLMDMERMRPARATQDMLKAYALEEKLPMDYAPRKISLPETQGRPFAPVEVLRRHLDTNRHVNNGQYIAIAMEYLPDGYAIRQMRAEYKKQAHLGDRLIPVVYEDGTHTVSVVLNSEDGMPYCVAEFMLQAEKTD